MMDTRKEQDSEDRTDTSLEAAAVAPPAPAVTAAAAPSHTEQRRARRKQVAAEESWEPEDAEWAEEAVQEDSEALFRSIYECSAVGIALVDLNGCISKSNPALANMLGYSVDELPGHAFTDLSHPEDSTLDLRYFESLKVGDGDHLISDEDDLPRFIIGVVEDVSERHNAEEAVRQRDLGIREAYTQVIAAVTGGKLVLLGQDEIAAELGNEVWSVGGFDTAENLSDARHQLDEVLAEQFGDTHDADALVLASGEAMTNALKHAGAVDCLRLSEKDGSLQVEVDDSGPGIDFANLPNAALVPGFSSTTSLGMGFTIMLANCDRVLLITSPSGTRVILEARPNGDRGTPS